MYEYKVDLDRVIDGDTIDVNIDLGFDVWVNHKRVRLLHVDTPEKRTRDLLEKHFGYIATKFVTAKLLAAQKIVIKTSIDGGPDKYGRLLGVVWVDDEATSVNQQLIENRYAVRYEGQNKDLVAQAHLDNYKYLVENKIAELPVDLRPLYNAI